MARNLFYKSSRVLVGGVNSPVRAFKAVGGQPVFMRQGQGAYLTDVSGKRYLDYCLSWGPLILGHAHPAVVWAAKSALSRGSSFGAPTEAELSLAEAIQQALPSMQKLRFTSSGTEAVMSALRVARAFTKRDLIVKFIGGYHGHVDSLLVSAGSGAATLGRPDSAGVPSAWARTTISLPYNDLPALVKAFQRWGRQIAAVIVEPVAANMGLVLPQEGFLGQLRQITTKHGSLLIFDEVVTGFRVCYGGAQTLWNIRPDITCLGKIVGGGLPVGAYGGRSEIMDLVAPLGPVYQAGTLSGNPVAMAAGLATLKVLRPKNLYTRLVHLGSMLAQGLQELARRASVPVEVNCFASMFTVFFCDGPIQDYASAKKSETRAFARFFHAMLKAGIYLPPAQFETAFLSIRHTESDIERTLAAAERAFRIATSSPGWRPREGRGLGRSRPEPRRKA